MICEEPTKRPSASTLITPSLHLSRRLQEQSSTPQRAQPGEVQERDAQTEGENLRRANGQPITNHLCRPPPCHSKPQRPATVPQALELTPLVQNSPVAVAQPFYKPACTSLSISNQSFSSSLTCIFSFSAVSLYFSIFVINLFFSKICFKKWTFRVVTLIGRVVAILKIFNLGSNKKVCISSNRTACFERRSDDSLIASAWHVFSIVRSSSFFFDSF